MGNKQTDLKKNTFRDPPIRKTFQGFPNTSTDNNTVFRVDLSENNLERRNYIEAKIPRLNYNPSVPGTSGCGSSSTVENLTVKSMEEKIKNLKMSSQLPTTSKVDNKEDKHKYEEIDDAFSVFHNPALINNMETVTIQSTSKHVIANILPKRNGPTENRGNQGRFISNNRRNNTRGGNHGNRGGNYLNVGGKSERGGIHKNRDGNRGNRSRGNQNNRGRNCGPGLLPTPGPSQGMDWFKMTPCTADPNQGFTANDLPIRNNYGGRYTNNDDTRSESNMSNRGGRGDRRGPRNQFMGFKKLEEILQMEPDQIVIGLCSENAGFEKLLKSELSNDYIVLIITVISKCCQTTFCENKGIILSRVCEKEFIDQLIKYLNDINLHDRQDKFRNRYFWERNNKDLFLNNLTEFYQAVIDLIPNTACEILPKLIKQTILTVNNLDNENVDVPDSVKVNLEDLQEKIMLCVDEREKKKIAKQIKQDEDPPDDYRQISLYPMVHEITQNESVFLRPNIIDGSYQNTNHYLDVHFRLLREDFVAPLRNGICSHLSQQLTKEKKRIFNVRFYDKIMFVGKNTVQDKVCIIVQLNMGKRKIKLENTRRFMFGSLLCFTNNNFQSVVFGTVISRDKKLLEMNQIAVDIIDNNISYFSHYTMVECSVYFVPYYHVLKALQVMTEDKFPLKRYIIDVEPEVFPPKYLNEESIFEHEKMSFYSLHKENWPDAESLGLDKSQFLAFQAALTKEFCVIQGPPGTGKTFIGLKIAQVLIENCAMWNSNRNPILVICFTNHALDQFLEGISHFTNKIVRIGGQSKNENLNVFNIKNVRTTYTRSKQGNRLIYQKRDEIRDIMNEIKICQKIVDCIMSCNQIIDIKSFNVIDENIYDSWFLSARNSELLDWLMGGRNEEERYQERRQQRIAQVAVMPAIDAKVDNDSEEEFFDPEEEQQREIDDVDQDFDIINLYHINSSSLLTQQELQDRINILERKIADLEVRAEETNDFVVFNAKGMAEKSLRELYNNYDYFNYRMNQLKSGNPHHRPLIIDYNNPQQLTPNERWGLYAYWVELYKARLIIKINRLHHDYRMVYRQYEEVKQMEDICAMKYMQIVGMTTTGAAQYQTLLQALKCPIVIVEEAAEVLESHVIVALTNDCQQLILIGDHKQLRPTTSEYRLRKDCNLDISLFERMVSNNIHCETLEVQHRMRPEIVKLIVPAIYPKLESHASVYTYPPVHGVNKNLFFITHTEPEEAVDDSGSRRNVHEAKFLIKLARYFILQGYEPEDITILAAYSGQMFCLWKERKNIPLLKDVRITGVDNYQGEENKIILLSLVRSNEDSNIGFLRTDNRVNVALSRAKEGLYIMGNMSILEKSDNAWPKIKQVLEENNQIGTHLILQCQIHSDQLTAVQTADDFQKVSEGGCSKLCQSQLNCGHICKSLCHITDREHNIYKCQESCTRGLCEIGHPCPLKCFLECKPCMVLLSVILKCGHQHDLPCHLNDTSKYPCPTLISTVLECGHTIDKPCFRDAKTFPCSHECEIRRLCGHACDKKCHIYNDPDHLDSRCFKKCARISTGCTQTDNPHICQKQCYEECMNCEIKIKKTREPCGHIWTLPCHEPVNDIKCTRRCKNKLNCGHNCKLECWEICGKCNVKVDKIIESCGHKIKTNCDEIPDRMKCGGKCPRLLACGHPCNKKCNEPCRTNCKELVDSPHNAACGHQFKIPCSKTKVLDLEVENMEILKYCTEPCTEILQCSHPCAGTCGQCAQGRIHRTCLEKCGANLICGHECEIPCRETCQPCNKKCYYRCDHNKCPKKCGEPCTDCKEQCTRRCIHAKCTKLCSQPCNVPPCNEPCPKLLKCKHPCIGFCGELCPPVCRVCQADDETFDILFGDEAEPDARFVHLKECKHNIEAGAMDTWMKQHLDSEQSQEINIKRCPKCKEIIMVQRYSEYIRKIFKDISEIKKKLFLEDNELSEKRTELQTQVAALRKDNLDLYKESHFLKPILIALQSELVEVTKQGKRNPINKISLENCRFQIELIKNLAAIIKKANIQKHRNFEKCVYYFDFLLKYIHNEYISKQKRSDLSLELKRFEKLIHLLIAESHNNFNNALVKPSVKKLHENLRISIYSIDKYSTEQDIKIRENLKTFCEEIDRSIVLHEQELKMVISAMQMGVGCWYKCPNGHLYVITECGGATVTSYCNECGERIGGTQHQHLPSNQRTNLGDPNRERGFNYRF